MVDAAEQLRGRQQQPGGRRDGVERVGRCGGGGEGDGPAAGAPATRAPGARSRSARGAIDFLPVARYVPYVRRYVPYVRMSALSSSLPRRGALNLPRDEARRRYVDAGELAVLEQIRIDSGTLDERSIAVGPFSRLDAGVVAASDGKTRGAITNLFGSQAAYQAETMELALSAGDWIEQLAYPAPEDFADAGRLARRAPRAASPSAARGTAPSPTRRLRLPVGAVAERRALRDVERPRRRAQPRGARPVGRAARARVHARAGPLRPAPARRRHGRRPRERRWRA